MKFETYVHKIVLDHQPNFHIDPCKDTHAQGKNARTCDALQRFRSESTKIEKMRFFAIVRGYGGLVNDPSLVTFPRYWAFIEYTPKKVTLFTFANQAKIL